MIPKLGKPPNEVTSHRPISLLPVVSKLFKKLLLKWLKIIIEKKDIVPTYQSGFIEKHSTTEQVHRLTDVIENMLEEKKYAQQFFLMYEGKSISKLQMDIELKQIRVLI
jgi:hypothetical protein